MTSLTKTALGLVAGLMLATGIGAANAAPSTSLPQTIEADAQAGVALSSGRLCYPRFGWTYRVGFGFRRIVVGVICIPYLVRPYPFPFPGPGPGPERIGPRVAY